MPDWVQVFTALLIDKVNETDGKVIDCPMVIEASNRYQEKQDFYAQFCNEIITKGTTEDRIKKTDIRTQFNSWYSENMQAKPPRSQDLYDYLNKRLGKARSKKDKGQKYWWGWKIVYECTMSEDEEDFVSTD